MASPRIVQKGKGAVRPLVVMYHLTPALDHVLTGAVSERACIVNITLAHGKGHYRHTWGDNPSLGALTSIIGSQVGDAAFWPIVLCGFSEGCQGVRTQLPEEAAYKPTKTFIAATVAIDGIHSSNPPSESGQLRPWREWFIRCGALFSSDAPREPEMPIALVTMTQIDTGTFGSVRETFRRITGWVLSVGETKTSGNLIAEAYPGKNKTAHSNQARVVLGQKLAYVASQLGFGSDSVAPTNTTLPTKKNPMGTGTRPSPTKQSPRSSKPVWWPVLAAGTWLGAIFAWERYTKKKR